MHAQGRQEFLFGFGAAVKDKPPHLARLVKPHRLAW